MEYYIYTTKNCNLNCRYCSGIGINKGSPRGRSKVIAVEKVIDFLSGQVENNGCTGNSIVFYGGEPLLNQDYIIDIIRNTKFYGFKYLLYTNGTLLNSIDPYLAKNINVLFVSVDGLAKFNELHRGENVFEKAIKNYLSIKDKFKGRSIARITLTKDNLLYDSVLFLLDIFDSVFWQLESSSSISRLVEFKSNYIENLHKLKEYWLKNLCSGIVKDIIPFQSIIAGLLQKERNEYFRCGCGRNLVVLNNDGICYICDELIENPEFVIGDVYSGLNNINGRFVAEKYYSKCGKCNIRYICGGRCLKALVTYPETKIKFYCDCTKEIIGMMKGILPAVESLIGQEIINMETLNTYEANYCTEEIP